LQRHDPGIDRGPGRTGGDWECGRRGGRIGQQAKQVSAKRGSIGQSRLSQRSLRWVGIVVARGYPGAQRCERGIELTQKGELLGFAGIEAGVGQGRIQLEGGLNPGAHQGDSSEDGNLTGQAKAQTEEPGADIGMRIGSPGT
jgi:hypothetical protein